MEPRTHYQISLTARQAVGIFVGLLLALGLAFFFGLMTGLSGRGRAADAESPRATAQTVASGDVERRTVTEALPAVETAVPTARGEAAAMPPGAGGVPAEATPPPTLQTFEDGGGEEAAAPVAAARAGAPAQATPGRPAAAPGRVWVQVASVSSRSEADALSQRLGRHGYHTAVVTDKGHMRVRVGPYRTTEDARHAAEKLRKQEKIKSPWVVFEGK